MPFEIQLENVVLAKEGHYFIAVQVQYDDKVTPGQKFRTDLAAMANRPHFKRNLFTFSQAIARQKIKFGLMACANGQETSVSSANMLASASISISLDRLKTLPNEGHRQILYFLNKQKDVGQFECIIRYRANPNSKQQGQVRLQGKSQLEFNPLISRIIFTEQRSKDQVKMEASLSQLERQMTQLYKTYNSLKEEQEGLQTLLATLKKDEEEIKSDIQTYERINQKIALKISQKEHLQSLRLQIDMLKNTEQGKRLLLERLQYFEQRIILENQQYRKLAEKYEQIKGQIDRRIKSAQDYANRLKAKEMQEFQLQRNKDILSRYQDVEYEFTCNQQIIRTLASKTTRSQLTAEQAALLLSQVNFHIQLEQVDSNPQEGLLKMIEGEAAVMGKYEPQKISEEQRLVLEIKLGALQEEISTIRNKIKRVLPKGKGFVQSQVTPL